MKEGCVVPVTIEAIHLVRHGHNPQEVVNQIKGHVSTLTTLNMPDLLM